MITIEPATLNVTTWLAANARPRDRDELMCQVAGDNATLPGYVCHQSSPEDARFVARYKGEPIAAFGLSNDRTIMPTIGNVWAFGTTRLWRAIPAISRHFTDWLPEYTTRHGIRRIEVRALASHDIAHRWITRLGMHKVADLPQWGKDGEDFVLYATTHDTWTPQLYVTQPVEPQAKTG